MNVETAIGILIVAMIAAAAWWWWHNEAKAGRELDRIGDQMDRAAAWAEMSVEAIAADISTRATAFGDQAGPWINAQIARLREIVGDEVAERVRAMIVGRQS